MAEHAGVLFQDTSAVAAAITASFGSLAALEKRLSDMCMAGTAAPHAHAFCPLITYIPPPLLLLLRKCLAPAGAGSSAATIA